MKLLMYEVQFSHLHAKGGWRPNVRRFVFTTDPVRAMALATKGYAEPVVQQVILRSGDGGVILDPECVAEVKPQ